MPLNNIKVNYNSGLQESEFYPFCNASDVDIKSTHYNGTAAPKQQPIDVSFNVICIESPKK
jgi:hypothetical protein